MPALVIELLVAADRLQAKQKKARQSGGLSRAFYLA